MIGNAICYAATRPFYTHSHIQLREIIGFLIGAAGIALRTWSRVELGEMFTYVVGIRPKHTLVKTGPYKYLIHPSYTGKTMLVVGALVYMGFWSNFVLLLPVLGFLSKRVENEERVLKEKFGEEFNARKKTVKRFIPYVF